MADMFDMVARMAAAAPETPAPKREPWRSVDEWAMTRGKFSIAQYGIKPNADYGLFGSGPEMLGHSKDYRELMALADKFDKQGTT